MFETTAEVLRSGMEFSGEISQKTGLPVYCTTVRRDIWDMINNRTKNDTEFLELTDNISSLYPIDIFVKTVWQESMTFKV